MGAKYEFDCPCGRNHTVFVKDGKITHKTKGSGDKLIDLLDTEEEESTEEGKKE